MSKRLAGLMSLIVLATAADAHAGWPFHRRSAGTTVYATSTPGPATAPTYPYSYYMTGGAPARGYVGYGDSDFPFYGVRYGHPYDPWTWSSMSGSYSQGLDRYYAPPLR